MLELYSFEGRGTERVFCKRVLQQYIQPFHSHVDNLHVKGLFNNHVMHSSLARNYTLFRSCGHFLSFCSVSDGDRGLLNLTVIVYFEIAALEVASKHSLTHKMNNPFTHSHVGRR